MEWKCKQMEYDTGAIIYAGYHQLQSASDDDPNWLLYKYTYDGDDITKIQKSEGTWTDREDYF